MRLCFHPTITLIYENYSVRNQKFFSLSSSMKKIIGTTLFVKKVEKELIIGGDTNTSYAADFDVYVFQDTITKLHVLAIVYGKIENYYIFRNKRDTSQINNNIEENTLPNDDSESAINIRIHSSCITSEMLGSLDCDCVQQLNGALECFANEKNGIVFYLIQEGRGCGYLGKARACQLTQYNHQLTTFDAYKMLGMKDDYRSYHNIKEIIHILELQDFMFDIYTNNPDKINGISQLGIKIRANRRISFTPNEFNRKYLVSKKDYGHFLEVTQSEALLSSQRQVKFPSGELSRFVPNLVSQTKGLLNNRRLFTEQDGLSPPESECSFRDKFLNIRPFEMHTVIDEYTLFVASYYLPIGFSSFNRLNINLENEEKDPKNNSENAPQNMQVIWYQMSLFYDLILNCEFILLEERNGSKRHIFKKEKSKSIDKNLYWSESDKKKQLYYFYSENIFERLPLKSNLNKDFYRDSLQTIIGTEGHIILFNKHNYGIHEDHTITKLYYEKAKKISDFVGKMGISLILRMNQVLQSASPTDFILQTVSQDLVTHFASQIISAPKPGICVTGIGSSKYHAKFFAQLFGCVFVEFFELAGHKTTGNLVIISQGVNPTVLDFVKRQKILLLIHGNNLSHEKKKVLSDAKVETMEFLADSVDDTLARITGVFSCFLQIQYLHNLVYERDISHSLAYADFWNKHPSVDKNANSSAMDFLPFSNQSVSFYFIFCDEKNSSVGVLANLISEVYSSNVEFVGHIIDFIHGPYQSSLYKYSPMYLIFSKNTSENLDNLLFLCNSHKIKYKVLNHGNIWDYIRYFCHNICFSKNIVNQINWLGKDDQCILYDNLFIK
jgi:GTP cyclohydrolase II